MKKLRDIIAIVFIAWFALLPPDAQAQGGEKNQPRSAPQTLTPPLPPQQVNEGDVVRVDSDLVTLTATVTDARGRFTANLKRDDLAVYEDGERQELSYFNTGDRVPVSLGILFDTRGSMIDKIEGVEDAVTHFVKSKSNYPISQCGCGRSAAITL